MEILGAVPINTGTFVQFPLGKLTLRYLRRTTSTVVLISVVGFLDSIVAAKQNAARFGYSISPNRELVALGAGNIAGAAAPTSATLAPDLKRPGYHLSRCGKWSVGGEGCMLMRGMQILAR